LAWTRLALAVGCVATQLLSGASVRSAITVLAIAFTLYSLAALGWRFAGKVGGDLLSLVSDTIFFLVFAGSGTDRSLWVVSAFFVYLLSSAVVVHEWWDPLIVVGASAGFFAVTRPANEGDLWRIILPAGVLACLLALRKRRVKQLLLERIGEAGMLRSNLASVREDERQRIAGDFHDGPLQSFVSLQMRLEVLRRLIERDLASGLSELRDIQELIKAQVQEMRAFLRGMRPVPIEDHGLSASIRRIVAEFQKDSGISVIFEGSDRTDSVAPAAAMEVLQIVREALHNVQKHARASRAAVSVTHRADQLEVAVEDNGSGFAFAGSYTLDELDQLQLGPGSIRRRVRGLGGDCVLDSRPGRGSRLRIRFTL
jgi:signal transduction histidine kinase